ncbi:MAG: glutamate--tRNA ligase, partial [Candidatus Aenigmatarchaeota archaeon]
MKSLKETVLEYALQNAVFHEGKADPSAVLGKILGAEPELRGKVQEVRKEIEVAVAKVNAMTPEGQKDALGKKKPALLTKVEKKREALPDVPGAVAGKFVTRFAPSPTGPLNLGQLLRAAMLPYLYARKYEGKFILRIEDTDAKKIEKRFYDMIMEDLTSAGIKWDVLVMESGDMKVYHELAKELIRRKLAYVCTCPAEDFKALKEKKEDCACRGMKDSVKKFSKMLSGGYAEGEATVRMKTSMSHPNPAMRDPPMVRVCDANHPVVGDRYKVWPLYNFACAIEDHRQGVTHIFRGKEHEHNTSVQKLFYDAFGWDMPSVVNFGMVYLPGTKIHTRDMKQWIAEGKAKGWDDPMLPTVRALLRRGFQPEALRKFAEDVGITKNDIRVGWENIEGINRKIIDPIADRFMAVIDPVEISIAGAPGIREAEVHVHPDFPERGSRSIPVDLHRVYVPGDDFRHLEGKTVRLMGLGNMKLGKKSEYAGNEIAHGMQKIQWTSRPGVELSLLTPEGKKEGLGEPGLAKLAIGTMIQLERIGFGRVDSVDGSKVTI